MKVLKAIAPLSHERVVRGQVRGYLAEPGVAPGSRTETFAALELATLRRPIRTRSCSATRCGGNPSDSRGRTTSRRPGGGKLGPVGGPDASSGGLGDPALSVADDVAATGVYQGHRRRLTLGYAALDRARRILWIVTGAEKADALARLLRGDRSIPAGRVRRDRALLLADAAAASGRPAPSP